jgi:transcriptional regulator with XRE-family HTH domain
MAKSVFTAQYKRFLDLLRTARERAGISQAEMAELLHITQSSVSKIERGERRLDVVELWRWCQAIKIPLETLARDLDNQLRRH